MEDWLKIVITVACILVPLAVGIIAWWLNERSKLKWEKQIRKEDRYLGFLEAVHGFYVTSNDKERKEQFIRELRLAWLYCPDDVITAGNAFLDTVAIGVQFSDENKEHALAEFVIALRRDLHGKTKLRVEDHRNWRST